MTSSGASDLIDIACELRRETDKAIRVHDGDREAWLPLALIEIERKGGASIIVTMPEWLAREKDLI